MTEIHDIDRLLTSLLDADFRPVEVLDVELGSDIEPLAGPSVSPAGNHVALALVRLHGQPLGLVLLDLAAPDRDRSWRAHIACTLGDAIAAHLERDEEMRCGALRALAREAAVPVTVVVATRERPESLARCLASLFAVDYPAFDLIVVDNAPVSSRTRAVVESCGVRYVREDRRGLAAAHNAALPFVGSPIVAFTDDDVIVDRDWLAELAGAFVECPRVAATTGLIVPAELETKSQLLLEAHGRYIKGYEPRLFDLNSHRPPDPLFPFTAGTLGAGANMAFQTEFLRGIGGFDAALGTGTPARGGDDLAALFRVVMSGRTVAYRPGAVVWHHHRRDEASLAQQTYDYSVGLGAYLTSAIVHNPRALTALIRRLPGGISLFRAREDVRRNEHWPPNLVREARRGLVAGPFAYARSRLRLRESRRRSRS